MSDAVLCFPSVRERHSYPDRLYGSAVGSSPVCCIPAHTPKDITVPNSRLSSNQVHVTDHESCNFGTPLICLSRFEFDTIWLSKAHHQSLKTTSPISQTRQSCTGPSPAEEMRRPSDSSSKPCTSAITALGPLAICGRR